MVEESDSVADYTFDRNHDSVEMQPLLADLIESDDTLGDCKSVFAYELLPLDFLNFLNFLNFGWVRKFNQFHVQF